MLLTIDIGNTNIVVGGFTGHELTTTFRFNTRKCLDSKNWKKYFISQFEKSSAISRRQVHHISVSCVVPKVQKKFHDLCASYFGVSDPLYVNYKCKLKLTTEIEAPNKVGIDRLVNAAAACHKFKTDLIVIDMGTATTIDCVLKPGRFIGGLICPGPSIALQALCEKAAQLPLVALQKTSILIGKNTVDGMQSGLYYGYAGMIDALIDKVKGELMTKMTVVATGGLSALFMDESKNIDHYDPHLTLEGLRLVYGWNRKKG